MDLLIIEAIPKKDKAREGVVLNEFLRMTDPEGHYFNLKEYTNVYDLLTYIENCRNMERYDFVHLSGHGEVDETRAIFKCPKGHIAADEFPPDCFGGRTVALSACQLGMKAFIDPFMEQTGAKYVIAPQREVPFIDAAVFFVNFYYFVAQHGNRATTAFSKTDEHLQRRARGGFKLWGWG